MRAAAEGMGWGGGGRKRGGGGGGEGERSTTLQQLVNLSPYLTQRLFITKSTTGGDGFIPDIYLTGFSVFSQ